MHKPILCLDFDGVLHSYTSGWRGASVIPDHPVPGAAGFVIDAINHFRVCVFSSRSNQDGGIASMRRWMRDVISDHIAASGGDIGQAAAILSMIEFPTEKPPAMVTIDDRAITFTGEWPTMDALKSFRPWNKM